MTNKELLSRYVADLEITQILLRLQRDRKGENTLQSWREEIEQAPDTVALKAHATRTARALGGMGGIGDGSGISSDKLIAAVLEDLYATCKQLSSSLP